MKNIRRRAKQKKTTSIKSWRSLKLKSKKEQEALDSSMHDLDRRFDEKSLMYRSNLEYKVTKAKDTNRLLEQKAVQVRHQKEQQAQKLLLDHEEYERNKRKKLRGIYNSMNKTFKDFKEERAEHWHKMKGRKADDSLQIRQAKEMMIEKIERSERAVQAFMQQKAHKNMLSAELSKLKAQDMTKNHDRAKRLDKRIKAEIIEKEAQNAENVQKLKSSQ